MTILKPNAAKYLKNDHIPKELISRQGEYKMITEMMFKPLVNGDKGVSTVYCYGPSGTGKTVTFTKAIEEYEDKSPENVKIQYINGRKFSTYYQVLTKLVDELARDNPVGYRGNKIKSAKKGWSKSQAYEIFTKILEEHDIRLALVLDEIDKLKVESSKQVISMFYDLAGEYEGNHDVYLGAISNDPYLLDKYEEDIDRRVADAIHFNKYNAIDLKEILTTYAELSLKEGTWKESDIKEIAGNIAQRTGSATQAKRLLYHIGMKSEDKINLDYLDEAETEANRNMLRKEIESMPRHHKYALAAVAKCNIDWQEAQRKGSGGENMPTTGTVYTKYKEVCGNSGEDANTQRSLTNYLELLEDDSMITSKLESFGRGEGVTQIHTPTADANVILKLTEDSIDNNTKMMSEVQTK